MHQNYDLLVNNLTLTDIIEIIGSTGITVENFFDELKRVKSINDYITLPFAKRLLIVIDIDREVNQMKKLAFLFRCCYPVVSMRISLKWWERIRRNIKNEGNEMSSCCIPYRIYIYLLEEICKLYTECGNPLNDDTNDDYWYLNFIKLYLIHAKTLRVFYS